MNFPGRLVEAFLRQEAASREPEQKLEEAQSRWTKYNPRNICNIHGWEAGHFAPKTISPHIQIKIVPAVFISYQDPITNYIYLRPWPHCPTRCLNRPRTKRRTDDTNLICYQTSHTLFEHCTFASSRWSI